MLVQFEPWEPILGVRTNGGRLAVTQVTRIGTRFDSLRSHQFMKKHKRVALKVDLAERYKDIYESFLRKGFTTDQSFQLLLAVVKKKK